MSTCETNVGCAKRFERCENDLKSLQNKDTELNIRQVRMETKLDYMTMEIQKLSDKIDKVLGQPGKRWDNVITILITSGIVGLVTFFFARGGHFVG